MRLSLLILGIFAAIVGIGNPASAQNGAWCIYKNGDGDVTPQCLYATLQPIGWEQQLFTQPVLSLTGVISANQTPKALNGCACASEFFRGAAPPSVGPGLY